MNSQQDPYMSGGGFPMAAPNNNRSPGARLNSFTTHSFSNLRPGQRQMENAAQLSTPQYSTGNDPDRFNTVDSGFRHAARTQHSPGYAGDGYLNNSLASWSYNGGANTVNGAMGESRLRSGARRAVIPAEWLTSDPSGSLGSQPLPPPSNQYSSVMNYNQLGMMNGSDGGFGAGDRQGYQNMYDPRHEPKSLGSDLIPTAIVIKNIPFNVRKEMLTTIMSELGLPQPYAFNYHFDNGIFRGLAFANFQSPIDTQTVIEQLNGYEVQGRKLRVEYKKMLPEHERERIEREKREKRGQLEEQHQPLTLHSQSSMHSLNASHSTRSRTSPLRDVDLNNPDTLSFYTELTLFKNDGNREIIVFPSTITPQQRRTVHILAHNMGLEHRSVGEGADRQIHVLKDSALFAAQAAQTLHLPPGVSADAHRRGLSRAATIDFAETRTSAPGQFATLSRSGRHGPTLELPDSPDGGLNALRGVKSFADLRSYTPSPSLSSSGFPGSAHAPNVAQYGEYGGGNVTGHTSSMTTPTTPGTSSNNDPSMLIQDLGSMSLGDSFGSNRLRPREAPTPGAIGSQRPGLNGNSTRSVPERQPLGPNSDWNEGIGFGNRTRTNGHMQRGSDSSDAAVRGATSSSSSRFQ